MNITRWDKLILLLILFDLLIVTGYIGFRSSSSVTLNEKDNCVDKKPINVDQRPHINFVVRRPFHTIITGESTIYSKWQSRIMHYTYLKFKDHPLSDMGGFTRILHDGKEDDLMDEVPTFVAKPLPSDRGYVILNRPWGVWQWLARTKIDEDYILLLEPDYVFTKPMPNLANSWSPAAGSYSYIQPERHKKILQVFYPEERGNITDIDPIGAVPLLIKKTMLRNLVPTWLSVSMILQDDETSRNELGWLLEMYGYAIAAAIHNYKHQLDKRIFLQPPYDQNLGEGYTIHYTYAMNYTSRGPDGGLESHKFDKRNYIWTAPPKDLPAPSNETLETVHILLNTIKEASNTLPNWK